MADMFAPLVAQLKANPKTIVFTEGNDPRILEAASNRSRKRTRKYIKAAEYCQDLQRLIPIPKHWESFDTELLGAVLAISNPALTREIANRRQELETAGTFMSGRLAFRNLCAS